MDKEYKYNLSLNIGSIPMILFLVFLILKLTKVINWNWWWILLPIIIQLTLFVVFFIAAMNYLFRNRGD